MDVGAKKRKRWLLVRVVHQRGEAICSLQRCGVARTLHGGLLGFVVASSRPRERYRSLGMGWASISTAWLDPYQPSNLIT
jgi:hypothetical protein